MRLRTTLLAAAAGTALLLAALLATEQWGAGTREDGSPRWRFLLEDVADRNVYQQRGRWLPSGLAPYLEEHSEYPQLATWMFGLPYLFFDHHVPAGRPQTGRELREQVADTQAYFDLHHVLMGVGYLALIALTALNLRALGRGPGWALLLFLPGTAYFAFNRFDAWPAAFVALAMLLQWRGRRSGAAAALALGAMMKFYPALLLPLFLAHNLWTDHDARRAGRDSAADAAGAGGTPGPGAAGRRVSARALLAALPRAVLVPGLVAAAVVALILAVTFVQGAMTASAPGAAGVAGVAGAGDVAGAAGAGVAAGAPGDPAGWAARGWEAVAYVYRHHAGRVHNPPSLAAAILEPTRWALLPMEAYPRVYSALTFLQFLPALLLALLPVRGRRALIWGSLAVVVGFAEFGKVFSPQWICWVSPLALLLVPGRRALLALVVALELLIYVQIPVLYYEAMGAPGALAAAAAGRSAIPPGSPFWLVSDTRLALLGLLWAWSLAAFLRTVSRGAAPALAPSRSLDRAPA